MLKRAIPIVEVAMVLALFAGLRGRLQGTPFASWQAESLGAALVTSSLIFFFLPLAFVVAGRKNPGLYGLAAHDLAYHGRVGLRSAVVLMLSGLLFPVIGALGSTHEEWLGAALLTVGVSVVGYFGIRRVAELETRQPRAIPAVGTAGYVAMLVVGLGVCFALNPLSAIPARVVQKLIFVGFLEEFFFRGYLQSRLNDAFGRPYQVAGIPFGAGLVLSALIFGVAHPLTSPDGFPLPWAVWTGAGGLVFGILREKTGAAVAPAIAHGLWVLPTAFFGP